MMEKNKRLLKICIMTALLLAAGGLYYLAIIYLGVGVRCPFERLTGYLCPGCGMTRMCVSLIRGDIASAYAANPLTLVLMPFYVWLAGYLGYRYVEHGDQKLPHWCDRALWIIVAAYIVFGIARNI